jgi:hypothetical protein
VTRPDRIARCLYDDPIAPLMAVEPALLPEPVAFDPDPNPRGLPIYHPSGACTNPPGGCRPRILARCAGCRATFSLCMPSDVEMERLRGRSRTWRCGPCSEVSP